MKTDRINIYITTTSEKRIKEIAKKNHVSMSTTISELVFCFSEILPKLQDKYLITINDGNGKKTSIKPKFYQDQKKLFDDRKRNMAITNLIYVFTENKLEEYSTKDRTQHLKKVFYSTLQKRKEIYYNYNEQLRNNIRMAKDKKFMAYMEKLNAGQNQKTNG